MSHTARVSLAAARGGHSASSPLLRMHHRLRAAAPRALPTTPIGRCWDLAEGATDWDRGQAARDRLLRYPRRPRRRDHGRHQEGVS